MNDPNLDPATRQRALDATGILGAPHDPAFDDVVRIASAVCGAPIALVNFLGADQQYYLAQIGADGMDPPPVALSLCHASLPHPGVTTINDLSLDGRFMTNPLVTQAPNFRFYAGARVDSAEGVPLGTVCIVDDKARPDGLTASQTETLAALARQVMAQLELRRQSNALRDSESRFRAIADSMPQMVWSTLPDGYHDYYNARWYEFTGVPAGSTDGEGWNGMFHSEDQERAWETWKRCLETGEPYEIEYRLRRHDGVYRWTLGRALPIRGDDGAIRRWFGTCTDIDDAKRLLEERELVSQELSHRIKNIFAVISGLISLSARGRPEAKTYAANLRDRVMALGRAHDFVRPHSERSRPSAGPSTAFSMLKELFAPYEHEEDGRIQLIGDDIAIDDRAATPLALIFHELATNAAKYGSLSTPTGWVEVAGRNVGDTYVVSWTEQGGPEVSEPTTPEGFGSTLSRVSIEGQLGGSMKREWPPTGLKVTFSAPHSAFTRPSRVSRSGE